MTIPRALVLVAVAELPDALPDRRFRAQVEALGHSWTAHHKSPSLALADASGFAVAAIRENEGLVPGVHVLAILGALGCAVQASVVASTAALVEYRRKPEDPSDHTG